MRHFPARVLFSGSSHEPVKSCGFTINENVDLSRFFLVRTRDSWYHKSKEKSVHGYAKGAAEMKEMNIPVGVSDFEEIRKNGYYYIDKSGLIGELISRTGTKVTLITRPRKKRKT